MRAKTILLIFLLVTSTSVSFAQKEWSNWYYNGKNLLTFKNGPVEIVNDFIAGEPPWTPEYIHYYNWGTGSVSYSDPVTGEMKFIISNGLGFNREYKSFPNGSVLRACPDILSYHIIPFQNDPNKFYIIQFQSVMADLIAQSTGLQVRCPNAIGLGYSILDLSLDGGLGDFTITNKVITTGLAGQMTTVRHADGKSVWIIVHPFNSAKFHSYLVNDAGIQPAVVNEIGPLMSGGYLNTGGSIIASHDGKLLAGSTASEAVQLFDFDNATGIMSNYRKLSYIGLPGQLQFSPDNTKLYYLEGNRSIYQYDFNQVDISSSLTKIVDNPRYYMYGMQLAPDGKIYVTKTRSQDKEDYEEYTGAIECPNLPQYASNFNPTALATTEVFFPHLINDFINDPKAPLITKIDIGSDTAICFGQFTITAPTGWESYRWNTGETGREITVNKPGIYHVLVGNTGFSCPAGYGFINVTDKAIKLDLGPDTLLCPKTPFLLSIPNDYTNILWQNGSQTRDSIVLTSSNLIVSALDQNGCFTNDTISISHYYNPRADFGPDTTLCNNETLLLQLEPRPNSFGTAGKFLWQDGSQKDTFRITKPGTYWGQSTYDGCVISDTIRVSYVSGTEINLGTDTTLCEGDSLQLKLDILNAEYLWNTGATTSSIVIKNTGAYWVKVTNGHCTLTDSIQVSFQPKPSVNIGKDTTLCDGQKIILKATTSNASYLWHDNSTGETLEVHQPGWNWVQVTRNGCSVRDSISINYKSLPALNLGKDTTLCESHSVILNASHPTIASYTWQNYSTLPIFEIKQSGKYHVTVTGINGCTISDTITVSTVPLPLFSLGKDTTLCEGQSLQLAVNLPNAKYVWSTGHTGNHLSVTAAGLLWLEVMQSGCLNRDSILVNYKPLPSVNLGNDTTLCEGNSLVLNANYIGASYVWQDHSTKANLLVSTPGLYSVQLDLNGCMSSDSISVKYLYKPEFSLGNDTSVCHGETITLRPDLTNVSYAWQDGSGASQITISDPGVYRLTASNICGSTTKSIDIIRGLCELYLPDAFTPNGDGLNDVFKVKYPGFIKTFDMTIYNRWGQVIFKTTDPHIGWNGTFKQVIQPKGVYLWQINLINIRDEKKSAKGSIILLR